MWLVLNQKAPTWDFLQRKSWNGLGRFPLCKYYKKNISPMLIHCSYNLSMWKELEVYSRLINAWGGEIVKETFRPQCESIQTKPLKELPLYSLGNLVSEKLKFI